jgi:hypothetical protein
MTQEELDEVYFEQADEAGEPITVDGTTYNPTEQLPGGGTSQESSRPMTKEELDEAYFEQAKEAGEPLKGDDGTIYNPDGSKSKGT